MKKLLLIAIIGYASFIQAYDIENPLRDLNLGESTWAWLPRLPEDYRLLYYLPENSKIKSKCGQLYRAFIWSGESEIQCDDIENEFLKLTRQERDTLLQKSNNFKNPSETKILLLFSTEATSITPLQEETMVNLINLILSDDVSNEEKKKEFGLFLASSYKIAAKEVFRRTLIEEEKKFEQHLYQEQKEFEKQLYKN